MRSLRLSVRTRLTALYASLFLGCGAILLGLSLWLVSRHLHRTLPDALADAALGDLRSQYLLALVGTTLVSIALGWVVAGRVLRPLADITATARRVSQERLDERIALDGPHDELRELADTFDGMLDRLAGAFASQRRFVANASHELRTPLTVLRAEVDVALADPQASVQELRAMGETVRQATIECEQLLGSLLTLARSEAGLERRAPVDLNAAAERAIVASTGEAAERGIEVGLEAPGEPVVVDGDPRLLERLVANLVENAVRHGDHGGWATVTVRRAGAVAEVLVANSGAPIPQETVMTLVEPFQRGCLRRGEGPPGAGLGLSIVRSVAAAHDGTVRLDARPGGGLEVAVRLPGARPATSASPARGAAAGSRAPVGPRS